MKIYVIEHFYQLEVSGKIQYNLSILKESFFLHLFLPVSHNLQRFFLCFPGLAGRNIPQARLERLPCVCVSRECIEDIWQQNYGECRRLSMESNTRIHFNSIVKIILKNNTEK